MTRRKALTKADWARIYAAANRTDDGAIFADAVETIVRRRLIRAWDQGFSRGWTDGVRDATQDDAGDGLAQRPPNPYRAAL